MQGIGYGTASIPTPPADFLTSTFLEAFKAGYRHFDSAFIYNTEEPLGQAIAQAFQQGLIKNRGEISVTTKLWVADAHHDLVVPALKKSLRRLGLDYVDLYLIHWPLSLKQGATNYQQETGYFFKKEDLLPMDMRGTWAAMEECCRLGLAKSIGVSNFSIKKLSQILAHCTIPPAVNQVELNPAWKQKKLRKFCFENGIQVNAWSPLGASGAFWGSFGVMKNPILKEIAKAKGKSVAQISLRWVYQQGVTPIVKSFNKGRMKENLQIFDWELTNEELDKIDQIPQCRGFSGEAFISPQGPFKSIEELWDEL